MIRSGEVVDAEVGSGTLTAVANLRLYHTPAANLEVLTVQFYEE